MGYFTDTSAEVILCEIAIYRRMPELDVFDRFDLDRVAWETTIAGEWTTKVAYEAVENKAVRAYSVSWTIIAGSDNFPYKVYLKNDAGAMRILGQGTLAKAGDLNADYKEVTDELDYSWLCVDVFKEVEKIAREHNRSRSEVVVIALKDFLEFKGRTDLLGKIVGKTKKSKVAVKNVTNKKSAKKKRK